VPRAPHPHQLQAAEIAADARAQAQAAQRRASGFVPGRPPERLAAFVEGVTGHTGVTWLGVRFEVDGLPIAQGSLRAFVVKGRAVVTQGGDAARRASLGAWRQSVAARAKQAGATPVSGPVALTLTFRLPRPASRPKRERAPDRKPDLDRLVRSVLDALTGLAFRDDAQVVRLDAEKCYADPTRGETPGLTASVRPAVATR
jgi:crossover junction endodeoxyribonuclease RusA